MHQIPIVINDLIVAGLHAVILEVELVFEVHRFSRRGLLLLAAGNLQIAEIKVGQVELVDVVKCMLSVAWVVSLAGEQFVDQVFSLLVIAARRHCKLGLELLHIHVKLVLCARG